MKSQETTEIYLYHSCYRNDCLQLVVLRLLSTKYFMFFQVVKSSWYVDLDGLRRTEIKQTNLGNKSNPASSTPLPKLATLHEPTGKPWKWGEKFEWMHSECQPLVTSPRLLRPCREWSEDRGLVYDRNPLLLQITPPRYVQYDRRGSWRDPARWPVSEQNNLSEYIAYMYQSRVSHSVRMR